MTVKQYLMRAWQVDRRIERKIEERDRLAAQLESGVGRLTGMPRGGGHDWTDTAIRVMELTGQINREIADLCRVKREVSEAIDMIEDRRIREVMEMRYRNYMTWEEIARALRYDLRWVYRLHGKGLARVQDAIESQY